MKYSNLFLMTTLLLCFSAVRGQHPTYSYTPKFQPMQFPTFYNYNYVGTVSMKHHFKVTLVDGRDSDIYTKIVADSPNYYLAVENKAVGKKDSGRHVKLFPSQTKSISHVDPTTGKDYVGIPHDTCWLFKVIGGKINAYTPLAEISVDDVFIRYLQAGDDGPLIPVTDSAAAVALFGGEERSAELFSKKKYNRAVNRFNRKGEKGSD